MVNKWPFYCRSAEAWLLIALVTADTALKLIAFQFLKSGEPIRECTLCILLRVNYLNLGSAAREIAGHDAAGQQVDSTIFAILFGTSLLYVGIRSRLRPINVAASLLGAVACMFVFGSILRPHLDEISLPTLAAARLASSTFLVVVIWAFTESPLWKSAMLLLSAAGLSNSLSATYPPYRVVDYLWSSPLDDLLGLGVFNFADVLWMMGLLVLAIALLVSIVTSVRLRLKRAIFFLGNHHQSRSP